MLASNDGLIYDIIISYMIALISKTQILVKLFDRKARPPPKASGPPKVPVYSIDYPTTQLPESDKWLHADPEYPEAFCSTLRLTTSLPDFSI